MVVMNGVTQFMDHNINLQIFRQHHKLVIENNVVFAVATAPPALIIFDGDAVRL
jgi:hypothetical protein